jgi:hypothetical protein
MVLDIVMDAIRQANITNRMSVVLQNKHSHGKHRI